MDPMMGHVALRSSVFALPKTALLPSPIAESVLNGVPYQSISNSGVQSAISTLATQLSTYRSQGTAVAAVGVLRDVIEDVLRGQGGQVVETIIVPAANCELALSDPTPVTALTTIR